MTRINANATVPMAYDQDFVTVVSKRQKISSVTATASSILQPRRNRIRVTSISILPIVTKIPRTKSLFISRFSCDVYAKDIESLSYASFHVLVNEEDFSLINNTGIWPNGCLIASFFGRLNLEQIYSPEDLFFLQLVQMLSPNMWFPHLFLRVTMGHVDFSQVEMKLIPITMIVFFILL